jgi:hypothetical protein
MGRKTCQCGTVSQAFACATSCRIVTRDLPCYKGRAFSVQRSLHNDDERKGRAMKKLFLGVLAGCVGLCASMNKVDAAYLNAGVIAEVDFTGTNNYVTVTVNPLGNSGIGGSRPSCHNNVYWNTWAFDISTSKGKAMLSGIMAAYLAGKQVAVNGNGTSCLDLTTANVSSNEKIEQLVNFVILPSS